eukprot:CAMPEP_0185575926 /NCGR_PEP_ID=MMETSP0434-20130131/6986_1 /TAXON_ID=626734 ORGANISM="Favella taraikaensis, Strain Fe Narragansett Bay" /NCGR_SAMPLE_ID=MMETSP0434 /ASSEMBLY_ACC=CAM_ASM_000379 /LENGTH=110 /DNA_ID=CAMNT_0028192949 /DNA_START=1507 /DNA_END=1839 /DNA_ORIENTATION=-
MPHVPRQQLAPVKNIIEQVDVHFFGRHHDHLLQLDEGGHLFEFEGRAVLHIVLEDRGRAVEQVRLVVMPLALTQGSEPRRVLAYLMALPWQPSLQEVKHHIAKSEQVVTP